MNAPPDDERLYALLQQAAWLDALDWLHRAWRALEGDVRARRAADVFDDAFFDDLQARPAEALERRLLLHHGRMCPLSAAERARLREALAQKRPPGGGPASVQEQDATPAGEVCRERLAADEAPVRITRVRSTADVPGAASSLFKSPPERVFFEALREAFPTHIVYPNVALNAVLDYERLQAKLSQAERDYFFRALVDAVVVDPGSDWRPVYFFELDSAHHDRVERRRNDRLKDALLTKAGQTLFRLRRKDGMLDREGFARAIRTVVREA